MGEGREISTRHRLGAILRCHIGTVREDVCVCSRMCLLVRSEGGGGGGGECLIFFIYLFFLIFFFFCAAPVSCRSFINPERDC